jgi:hypothetical protein
MKTKNLILGGALIAGAIFLTKSAKSTPLTEVGASRTMPGRSDLADIGTTAKDLADSSGRIQLNTHKPTISGAERSKLIRDTALINGSPRVSGEVGDRTYNILTAGDRYFQANTTGGTSTVTGTNQWGEAKETAKHFGLSQRRSIQAQIDAVKATMKSLDATDEEIKRGRLQLANLTELKNLARDIENFRQPMTAWTGG